MPTDTFTLILTKGVHLISSAAASEIAAAIEARRATVEITLDPFGAVDRERTTLIAISHVVAITRNPTRAIQNDEVALIRGQRFGSYAKR